MTLSSLPLVYDRIFGICFLFLFTACIFGLVRQIMSGIKGGGLIPFSVCFLISFPVCIYFDLVCSHKTGKFTELLGRTPLYAFIILTAILFAGAAVLFIVTYTRIKRTLTPASLQMGLDGMRDGVLFSDERGMTVLINDKMQYILNRAAGAHAPGAESLDNIGEKELINGCYTEKQGDSVFLILPDKSVYRIVKEKTKAKKSGFNEYIAYDVTELYGKSLEIKKRNDNARQVNEQIREYSRKMDSMIRDRELLSAKIRIHDDMGRALLSLRSYLSRQEKDREALLTLWRVTVSVLRCETVPDVSDDKMDALIRAAEAVDVTLNFDGEIPDSDTARDISAAAIRECLTNTVKHAGGANLYIKITTSGGKFTVKIKNDGRPPDKPIEETGGLHTLRKTVESAGGEMKTEWENGFELTVTADISGVLR